MKFKAKAERSDQKKEGEHMVRSIVEALAEYAKVQPDKLFLADGKVELTYLDAWKCVYGYAVHLRELGIRRGDHVVVRNSQNAQLVISQLAIQLVGAVFVPMTASQRLSGQWRQNYIWQRSRVSFPANGKR